MAWPLSLHRHVLTLYNHCTDLMQTLYRHGAAPTWHLRAPTWALGGATWLLRAPTCPLRAPTWPLGVPTRPLKAPTWHPNPSETRGPFCMVKNYWTTPGQIVREWVHFFTSRYKKRHPSHVFGAPADRSDPPKASLARSHSLRG